MAEQFVIVCDVCGAPASASVNLAVHGGGARDGQKFSKDLCDKHLSDLLSSARKPRRGRRRGAVARAATAGARKPRAKAAEAVPGAPPRRRGRPRKSAPVDAASSEAAAG